MVNVVPEDCIQDGHQVADAVSKSTKPKMIEGYQIIKVNKNITSYAQPRSTSLSP